MLSTSPEVCLLYLPFGPLERPSLALGLLKVALRNVGIRAEVLYDNFEFATRIGLSAYRTFAIVREEMIGEWAFAGAAFPEFKPDNDAYLGRIADTFGIDFEYAREWMNGVRDAASTYIDDVVARVFARRPRIVALSSTFNQNCATLAFSRRLKALDPSVVTIVGGANCESEMGMSLARNFACIDFTISGEAEDVFPRLCQRALEHGATVPRDLLPVGVMTRESTGPAPRVSLPNMDTSPMPDFDDYFTALDRYPNKSLITPGLLMESARGCWWGQVHHCTFCGLNGGGMTFRSKSPARALEEFDTLSRRYGIRRFLVVDNIIDVRYFREVLPHLAAREEKLSIFYEIKANVTYEQMKALKDAGVDWIQPGIESLHDEALKLMDKGTWTWLNVQLLKWAREFGLMTLWNLLCGFPGEQDGWYAETADWLPLIFHLQPPREARTVRIDRFSPHQMKPEKYGLKLHPAWPYRYIYPLPEQEAASLVYVFEDEEGVALPLMTNPSRRLGGSVISWGAGRDAMREQVVRWNALFYSPIPPILSMDEEDGYTDILDTRPIAPVRRRRLSGLVHRVHRQLDRASGVSTVLTELARDGGPTVTESEVLAAIDELIEGKLVARFGNRLLALAVRGDLPELPRSNDEGYPGGWVGLPEALERLRNHRVKSEAAIG